MSLIKKAKLGELPLEQFMDIETLNWIKENKPEFKNGEVSDIIFDYQKIIFNFEKFYIKEDWFYKKEIINTIHGIRHMMRVLIYGVLVSDYLELDEKTMHKLCIASTLHDLRRVNDKDDVQHGCRAAEWFLKNKKELLDYFNLEMNKKDLEEIYFTIFFHDQDYKSMIDNPNYQIHKNSIDVFKTLDALDRYRLPKLKWWINDEYLNLKLPLFCKEFAYNLVLDSEELFLSSKNNRESIDQSLLKIYNQCHV